MTGHTSEFSRISSANTLIPDNNLTSYVLLIKMILHSNFLGGILEMFDIISKKTLIFCSQGNGYLKFEFKKTWAFISFEGISHLQSSQKGQVNTLSHPEGSFHKLSVELLDKIFL